jgi:hypothetical protein
LPSAKDFAFGKLFGFYLMHKFILSWQYLIYKHQKEVKVKVQLFIFSSLSSLIVTVLWSFIIITVFFQMIPLFVLNQQRHALHICLEAFFFCFHKETISFLHEAASSSSSVLFAHFW